MLIHMVDVLRLKCINELVVNFMLHVLIY